MTTVADIRYIEAPTEYRPVAGDPPSLFLAGGIPHVVPWHDDAVLLLEMVGEPVVILCPRRRDFPVGDPVAGELQVDWEHRHLHRASVTLFWFAAPDPDAPVPAASVVQPTTLLELGVALGEGRRIAVGVDPLYPRPDIISNQLRQYPDVVVDITLRATVQTACSLLAEAGDRRG